MDKEFGPITEETKENTPLDCADSEENISESFICCVCLDLLYKPVVLGCGHVSCFWCVHQSMNGIGQSSCPICRHSYHHFPTICQMLHFLIIKMYPNAYKRRHNQILEEEKKTGVFSPQFEISSLKSNSLGGSAFSSVPCSKSDLTSDLLKLETPECVQDVSVVVTEENNQSQTNSNGTLNQISITDVLCPTCKKLLFRPAVLNCGHAYCETCITTPEDEILICPICEVPHPSDFPKVCLELSNLLEETFPKEYAARGDSVKRKRVEFQQKSPPAGSSSKKSDSNCDYSSFFPSGDMLRWLTEHGPKVHFGAGCDYCGVLPIVGNRYRCMDCKERIGFDLCEKCYNTQSKLPGRFNQQHTAEHKFELIKTSETARSLMLNLVTGSFDYGTIVLSSDDSEDGSAAMETSVNPQENADNDEEDPAESNNNAMGDQNSNIESRPWSFNYESIVLSSDDSEDGSRTMEPSVNPQENADNNEPAESNNNAMGDQNGSIESRP